MSGRSNRFEGPAELYLLLILNGHLVQGSIQNITIKDKHSYGNVGKLFSHIHKSIEHVQNIKQLSLSLLTTYVLCYIGPISSYKGTSTNRNNSEDQNISAPKRTNVSELMCNM